jgi:ADP-heptose:LPS heptosyltransferase
LPENISPEELLDALLARREVQAAELMRIAQSPEFFRVVVEGLADRFDWDAAAIYTGMFAFVISRVFPEFSLEKLVNRYERVCRPREFSGSEPADVFVLSRVTLGADVAITSVILDAMKRRFPGARIWFVGSRKGWELFEADPRILHLEAPYNRGGTLAQRLAASRSLRKIVSKPDSIVVDPDSRLTQLGLMPVCAVENYYYFESRSSAQAGTLSQLTAEWIERTFGARGARPYIAPMGGEHAPPGIAVSLGTGGNADKRVADPFERQLLERLTATGRPVLIDKGAGGEESRRVEAAIDGLPGVRTWQGAFAPFAARIATSELYVGYDSAGQHVAAAAGVPLITVFAGFPNERFFERWCPAGSGRIDIVRVDNPDPALILERVADLLPRP